MGVAKTIHELGLSMSDVARALPHGPRAVRGKEPGALNLRRLAKLIARAL